MQKKARALSSERAGSLHQKKKPIAVSENNCEQSESRECHIATRSDPWRDQLRLGDEAAAPAASLVHPRRKALVAGQGTVAGLGAAP